MSAVRPRYSPTIDMSLELDGQRLRVAEVGPDFLVVEAMRAFPPARAVLAVTVDGSEVRRTVHLPSGIDHQLERQPMTVLETCMPILPVGAD